VKNLVLPGIGHFTVVDGQNVAARDLGNNFFVESASVGKSRAAEVARLLHELNGFVQTPNVISQDPAELIEKSPDFVKDYTLVIATELAEGSLLKLGAACSKHNVPLVVAQANGLIGYIRIQNAEHTIVESKPDFPPVDLRLSTPFPELLAFSDSFHLGNLESAEHSHVPFPVILLKAMAIWKENHDGNVPSNQESGDLFKESVLQLARKDEENFNEAYQKAHLVYQKYEIPFEAQAVLDQEHADKLTKDSPKFWIMANGVKQFVANEGQGKLPILGSIPDMHSTTDFFVRLQKIYRDKAESDAKAVYAYVSKTLATLGLAANHVTMEETQHFCKNSIFMKVIRYRSLQDEFGADSPKLALENVPVIDFTTNLPGDGIWYLAWRAGWRFREKNGRYPGEKTKDHKADLKELRVFADALIGELSLDPDSVPDDFLLEFCRFGNAQIHTISAVLGGVAAQEVIKLLTHQWSPMNNSYIFNGVRSSSVTFEV
jgi:amyloid beta precursor protein binding protein 1